MLSWKTKGTQLYQQLPGECFESLQPVDALSELPPNRPLQEKLFETWAKIKG
jgi:hypothetical protein